MIMCTYLINSRVENNTIRNGISSFILRPCNRGLFKFKSVKNDQNIVDTGMGMSITENANRVPMCYCQNHVKPM